MPANSIAYLPIDRQRPAALIAFVLHHGQMFCGNIYENTNEPARSRAWPPLAETLIAVYVGDNSLGHCQILSLNTRGPLPVAENVYHYATAIFNDVFRFRLILCGNYGALNFLTVQGAKSDAPLWELITNRIVQLRDADKVVGVHFPPVIFFASEGGTFTWVCAGLLPCLGVIGRTLAGDCGAGRLTVTLLPEILIPKRPMMLSFRTIFVGSSGLVS